MLPAVSAEVVRLALYRILLARRFDERLICASSEIPGWFHSSIGQECTAVIAAIAMEPDDRSNTTHRGHAHLLARGVDPKGLMAEVLGKAPGINRGYGGSMHGVSPRHGILVNSAMVGGGIPAMVGSALADQMRANGIVSVAWLGEGALWEGAVYEAMLLARLWQAPVVFACESDRDFQTGKRPARKALLLEEGKSISEGVGIKRRLVDGLDSGDIYSSFHQALSDARRGCGPAFIEVRTFAWPGEGNDPSVLPGGVTDVETILGQARGPRTKRTWHRHLDPLGIFVRAVIQSEIATRSEVLELDMQASACAAEALEFARVSSQPDVKVFREKYVRDSSAKQDLD